MLGKALAAFLTIVLLTPAAWGVVTISVNPEQEIAASQMTLGSIAEFSGDEEERIQSLKTVPLGAAPKPGSRLVLTRELLGARLAASGADFSNVTWRVPDSVTITASSQTIAGMTIETAARDAVLKCLNVPQDKREVELFGRVNDITAPPGKVTLSAELPYGIRKGGVTPVNVLIAIDGRLYEKAFLHYNIKVYEDVLVAARPIAAHEQLTPDNLAYQRLDTLRLVGAYATDIDKLAGLYAKRAITAGTLITESLVEKPVLVKRGSNVIIMVKSGEMTVSAAGIALQDGLEGQIIRVQNANSKRILTAKVIGEGIVQVIFIK